MVTDFQVATIPRITNTHAPANRR